MGNLRLDMQENRTHMRIPELEWKAAAHIYTDLVLNFQDVSCHTHTFFFSSQNEKNDSHVFIYRHIHTIL